MGKWIREEETFYHWSEAEYSAFLWLKTGTETEISLEESFQKEGAVFFFYQGKLQEPVQKLTESFIRFQRGEGAVFIPEGSRNYRNWLFLRWNAKAEKKTVAAPFVYKDWNLEFRLEKGTEVSLDENGFLFQGIGAWQLSMKPELFWKGEKALLLLECEKTGGFQVKSGQEINPESLCMVYSTVNQQQEIEPVYMYPFQKFLPKTGQPETKETELFLKLFAGNHWERLSLSLPEGRIETNINRLFDRNLAVESGKNARAVLEKLPLSPGGGCYYYLSPGGAFSIPTEDMQRIPCGNSALEYVELSGTGTLHFLSGNPGYVQMGEGSIQPLGTIPYVTITKDTGNAVYYSQPLHSRLFSFEGEAQESMEFLPVPYGQMSENTGIPVFWEEGISQGMECGRSMETLVFAQERNRILALSPALAEMNQGEVLSAISEKGMLIKYTPEALAENIFLRVEFSETFFFGQVSGKLKCALQFSNPLLLLEGKEQMEEWTQKTECGLEVLLDGWGFDLSFDTWEENGVLLILKYTSVYSIQDALEQTELFGISNTKGIEKLQAVWEDLQKNKIDNRSFDALRSMLSDKNWCGALAFHIPLQRERVPGEVSFVIEGITGGTPQAYYLAFSGRKAGQEAKADGILYYEAPVSSQQFGEEEYNFQTERLQVVFQNGKMTDFTACSHLYIKNLFQSRVWTRNPERGNYLIFEGSIQETKEGAEYLFVLKEPVWYRMVDSVIDTVGITGGRILNDNGKDSRFVLEGIIQFRCYETDLFSYGQDQEGLHFRSYEIAAGKTGYGVCYSRIQWDEAGSVVRQGSLKEQFPVILKGFLMPRAAGEFPQDMGYEGIYTEGLGQQELREEWKGFVWEISLGELGALAPYEEYKLEFITAYSPGEPETQNGDGFPEEAQPALYIGMKSISILPVQGIMKLDFKRVELRKKEKKYYLFLREFALRMFGIAMPSGSCDIYLLGDEAGSNSSEKKLAWYAAYEKRN